MRKSFLTLVSLFALVAILGTFFWSACSTERSLTSPTNSGSDSGLNALNPKVARVMEIQDRHTPELMNYQGVVGTATALDENGDICIKIYTNTPASGPLPRMPVTIEGVNIVTEESGPVFAHAYTARYRPVPNGVSIGNNLECASGTIGCVFRQGTSSYFLLSNNHVFARENAASIGESLVQPGRYDNKPLCANKGTADQVATLADFQAIQFGGACNSYDGATAAITLPFSSYTCASPTGVAAGPGTATASIGLGIQKFGRTTSLTTGSVAAINWTGGVGYTGGTATFCGQIVTTSRFDKSGDSGSLVTTSNSSKTPVALLFAGTNNGTAIVSPIGPVMTRFNVTAICPN